MHDSPKTPIDPKAAIRQQRRRQRLKEEQTRLVQFLLTAEQGKHLDALLEGCYAPNQSAVMAKALDEAYERENYNKEEGD